MLEAYLQFRTALYDRPGLEPKVQELILIALDTYTNWPNIRLHMRRCIEQLGVSKEELIQTLVMAGLFGGIHSFAYGLEALDEVLQDIGAEHP